MQELEELRKEIDNIDKELTELFERRMEIALKVAKYKREKDIPILNENREKEVIKKNLNYLKNQKFKEGLEKFFKDTMDISRKIQREEIFNQKNNCKEEYKKEIDLSIEVVKTTDSDNIKVGFQGVKGSFSEEALLEYFGSDKDTYNVESFEAVFEAINNDEINYGVLPIENSSTGGISDVYDLLRKYGFFIVGEKIIKVNHNLLGIPGSKLENIKEVYSHIQAFCQSDEFLKKHDDWKCIPYRNTAISAKYIKQDNCKYKAAIGSKRCAEVYGLDIIEKNINYNKNNYTRFIVVGKELECDYDYNKVSIILALPHKSGVLYNVLSIFAENNLNMLKIESRPIIGKPWEYYFYIDFEGNITMENVKKALKCIKVNSSYFKILGNYKLHKMD
ncbi:chorismate mutase [Clostridium brassicae]|uniref:Bifunctional chorismate mutase/prephenate dehydratase n=1 Tax=Clostridium brassicae TaxID=2999072 RepID=A0ABT4DDF0_9CLOT|nr:chorismate mutase [Clostridium brassicae]MCY6959241.1 chorismate mutase [Clostridium brassicae]